jgi:hypothetical protein
MTPLFLTLASLTPGDGGPGMGAATAPAIEPAVFLRGEWEGILFHGDGRWTRFDLADGKVAGRFSNWVILPDGPGQVRVEVTPTPYLLRCIWKLEGCEVIICGARSPDPRPSRYSAGEGFLIELKPAAPRKP